MAKLSEARTQIYLPREQHQALQRVARARDTSMAQVVREAVDAYLAHLSGPSALDDEEFRSDPIWSLPDCARDFGRDDAATDHDTLLYGHTES